MKATTLLPLDFEKFNLFERGAYMPTTEPTKDQPQNPKNNAKPAEEAHLEQEYGLFDPRNKSLGGDRELIDNQQRYDNSIQESEVILSPADVGDRRKSLDDANFASDFFEFSKSYHDNENGPPGVDEDYGVVTPVPEPILAVEEDASEEGEVVLGESIEENLGLKTPKMKQQKTEPMVQRSRPETPLDK